MEEQRSPDIRLLFHWSVVHLSLIHSAKCGLAHVGASSHSVAFALCWQNTHCQCWFICGKPSWWLRIKLASLCSSGCFLIPFYPSAVKADGLLSSPQCEHPTLRTRRLKLMVHLLRGWGAGLAATNVFTFHITWWKFQMSSAIYLLKCCVRKQQKKGKRTTMSYFRRIDCDEVKSHKSAEVT